MLNETFYVIFKHRVQDGNKISEAPCILNWFYGGVRNFMDDFLIWFSTVSTRLQIQEDRNAFPVFDSFF